MLAHLYCAESLIMLNRCGEARAYLEPKFIIELKEDDFIHRGSPDWNINSLNAAQSILEYNLCVLLVLQGDTEVAKAIINRCTHPIVFTHLKMLKIFMELKAGNYETCRFMIRIDTPQFTWYRCESHVTSNELKSNKEIYSKRRRKKKKTNCVRIFWRHRTSCCSWIAHIFDPGQICFLGKKIWK